MKKLLLFVIFIFLLGAIIAVYFYNSRVTILDQEISTEEKTVESKEPKESVEKEPIQEPEPAAPERSEPRLDTSRREPEPQLPEELVLAVPFTSQAPFANWTHLYNETCEEAAIVMVDSFYQKRELNPTLANQLILDLVEFENEFLGFFESTTASELKSVVEAYYDYDVKLIYGITVEDIKKEVFAGRPVIVPAHGRSLGNPNFTPPGPLYHMLVIKGYGEDEFITNDPGTRKGEGYRYPYDVLLEAVHDWNGGDVINGKKVMIVVKKSEI